MANEHTLVPKSQSVTTEEWIPQNLSDTIIENLKKSYLSRKEHRRTAQVEKWQIHT